ncbi:HD family phosphohydrolase [Planomicrobium sp. YIM 101495]|uniref:HD family phosphohydrolase n=1 Tax=Planomicrobium sp. YIM 101495 TaxID=2665160 RepID=UPI0012BA2CF6|nr:HDIG domain-containing metalloprotein [Planomicrobium sp. YIM 101495]MTD29999.1 HDIG domain-containing protein [Planomicrobium sp. YIM 101495]
MLDKARRLYDKAGYKAVIAVLTLLIGVTIYAFLVQSVTEDTYQVELFKLSEETIRSNKTVEDPVKTEQERVRAENEIAPSYQFIDEQAANQSAVIESLFGYILDAKESVDDEKKPADIEAMVAELGENLRLMENSENGLRLTDDMLRSLLALPEKDLTSLKEKLKMIVEDALEEPVRDVGLNGARNAAELEIRGDASIPATVLQPAIAIARFGIVPTETINEDLTEAQIDQARKSIEPTKILQGQVLVQEGQIIDREVFRQLELAGMTEQKDNIRPMLGLLLFVAIIILLLFMVLARSKMNEVTKVRALTVTWVVTTISLTLMLLVNLLSDNFDVTIAFLFPTALASMIVRILFDERTAVYTTFLIGTSAGLMMEGGYASTLQMDIALYILFGGLAGVFLIGKGSDRNRLLWTSLSVAIVNALFIGFYLLISQTQYSMGEVGFYIVTALLSGLLSGALTFGLMPFFETAFGLLSPIRLIELSNPNHPLLKKILTETPGTYHHSVMVANLADAACEEIGANGLLARVACYYHDIGKTIRPHYFIENQMNMMNPHDHLPPDKSRDIILSHTVEGAELLRKHKMPKEFVDVAMQHHGTSLLKFFYMKAKELNPHTDEKSYRYEGPKPQTREIAVISVADSVEAAVRSMKEPTPEKIEKLVGAIIEDKVKDGQFNECDLTMKELVTIKRVMCETLNGIFHSRIEYPSEKEIKERIG